MFLKVVLRQLISMGALCDLGHKPCYVRADATVPTSNAADMVHWFQSRVVR
jgi:hypothetical protein